MKLPVDLSRINADSKSLPRIGICLLALFSSVAFTFYIAVNSTVINIPLLAGIELTSLVLTCVVTYFLLQLKGVRNGGKKIQDSDALLETLNFHAIISIADRAGNITGVNEAFCKISGYAREELIGKNHRVLNSGEQSDAFWTSMWHDISNGIPWRGEVCNLTKNGNLYWLDTVIAPFVDHDGQIKKYVSIRTDITASKTAALNLESSLRESSALLSTLNLHSIVSVANRAGNITEVNDAFCQISGYSREELIGNNHRVINSGTQSAEFWNQMWQSISSGNPWRGEVCNRAKDGSLYWVDTVIAPFQNKNGLIEKYVSVRTDITASKESAFHLENALRENNALLTTLNSHAIVSIANRAGFITEANDAFCKISGYSRHELIGKNHRVINSGTHPPEFWKAMWRTISSGKSWRGQVCNRAKNGSLYWVDTFVAPFLDEKGQIEKYISIRIDITASKLADDSLRWNESLLKMMSNSSPLGFLVVDSGGDNILYFNQEFCTIWGIEHLADGMRNGTLKNKDVMQACMPAVANPVAYLGSCLSLQDESNCTVVEDEIPFAHERMVRRFSTQIRDDDHNYVGRFYIYEDVTESKRVERALKQAIEASQSASQAKSQFLANMSHELRTPMNTILGMLALMRKTGLSPQQADYAAKGDAAARALLNMLNEVLDFSKIEAGKMELNCERFNLKQTMADLASLLSGTLGDKPLSVTYNVDPSVPENLLGDSMRLQQVLVNLGTNAIKFTDKGEVVVSVVVESSSESEVILKFSFRDTGIGIALHNQFNIFKGFIQAEASTTRRYGGTGLGLAISQRIIDMMGGKIEVESTQDVGSLFHFSIAFPVLNTIDTGAQQVMTNQSLTENKIAQIDPVCINIDQLNNQHRLPGVRILVAEDHPNNQQVIKELLESEGALVLLANNGQEALDIIKRDTNAVDVVLMDLQMPVMDGYTATTQIRISLGLQQLPIIAITANTMKSDREACLAAGMNDHVGKPFDFNQLVGILLKHINRQENAMGEGPQKIMNSDAEQNLAQAVTEAALVANVELTSALNRIGNKTELYWRMLTIFVKDLVPMSEQLKRHLVTREFDQLQHIFHGLKGISGTLGINDLMNEFGWAEKQFSDVISLSRAEFVVTQVCNMISSTSPNLTTLTNVLKARQNEIYVTSGKTTEIIISLPHDALIDVIKKMMEQLNNYDMAAIESMNVLRQNSDNALLTTIDEAINSLNFEKASELCNSLLEAFSK